MWAQLTHCVSFLQIVLAQQPSFLHLYLFTLHWFMQPSLVLLPCPHAVASAHTKVLQLDPLLICGDFTYNYIIDSDLWT